MTGLFIGMLIGISMMSLFIIKDDPLKKNMVSLKFIIDKIAKQVGIPETSLDHDLKNLIAKGKKIEAIKEFRKSSGIGLKEAKEYVDNLTDINLILNKIAKQVGVAENSLDEELKILVAKGKKIEAIKQYRKSSGLGLKEAKDYVDNL
ncbi:MAG: ribosomal protein L7/L12 [Clostridiaceae bacterium]|nr:ribosomal protein L7/L12 [Clostridiaceae bacterium]